MEKLNVGDPKTVQYAKDLALLRKKRMKTKEGRALQEKIDYLCKEFNGRELLYEDETANRK